ncbi:MAG: hypothetical protein FJ034_04995 [Chloroflexi bacterium]|nr:hypothetical protein [Chloroflexota bacterium]
MIRHVPFAALLALGAWLRAWLAFGVYPTQGFAGDLSLLKSWAETLVRVGPSSFYASTPQADYPPAFLYVLWIEGALSLPIKFAPFLADIAIAVLVYAAASRWHGVRAGLLGAAVFLFLPVTWYDSALWGQVDSVVALPMLVALLLLIAGRSEWAAAFGLLAIVTKPQGVIILGILVPVLVARHLIQKREPVRIARALLAGSAALVIPLLPFDITRFASPALQGIPVAGHVSGLGGLFLQLGDRYPVLSANAYNLWALVGPRPLAGAMTGGPNAWTPDSLALFDAVPAVQVGALLLVTAGLVVAVGLLFRNDRYAIVLGFALVALAFYLLPTRVHERYAFPFFMAGSLLVAGAAEWLGAFTVVGVLNAVNLHAVLAPAARGGFQIPGRGFGGLPVQPAPIAPPGGGGRGVTQINLPLGDLARSEAFATAVALGQIAAFAVLLCAWVACVRSALPGRELRHRIDDREMLLPEHALGE